MPIVSIAELYSYFETGDKPTQPQFQNLIDTLNRFADSWMLRNYVQVVPYTAFQPNATQTGYIALAPPVDTGFLFGTTLHLGTRFQGGASTSAVGSIIIQEGGGDQVLSSTELNRAPGGALGGMSMGFQSAIVNTFAGHLENLKMKLQLSGGIINNTINNLTQGSMNINYWILYHNAAP